jgi:riboflavin synthase
MFTGIITGLGHLTHIAPLGDHIAHGKRVTVQSPPGYLDDVHLGDSIALQGACMTVTSLAKEARLFTVEISAESLRKTTGLDVLGPINLEKALRASDRLGGHLVSGHVDGLGQVAHFSQVGESWELRIQTLPALAKYLAYKGSITVNGVSLTVNQVSDLPSACQVSINLIAHTLQHTTLGSLVLGQAVNIEVDQIARYCERMLSYQNTV